jgi:hypothetical protein
MEMRRDRVEVLVPEDGIEGAPRFEKGDESNDMPLERMRVLHGRYSTEKNRMTSIYWFLAESTSGSSWRKEKPSSEVTRVGKNIPYPG